MESSSIINLRLACLSVRRLYETISSREEVSGPLMSPSKCLHPSNHMTGRSLSTPKPWCCWGCCYPPPWCQRNINRKQVLGSRINKVGRARRPDEQRQNLRLCCPSLWKLELQLAAVFIIDSSADHFLDSLIVVIKCHFIIELNRVRGDVFILKQQIFSLDYENSFNKFILSINRWINRIIV